MQSKLPLPCVGRLHLSGQALHKKSRVRTEKPSEVTITGRITARRIVGKDIDDLPYKETIVPFPAGLPFASQMVSFRSRIKVSTIVTVSRWHLVSDYATYPDMEEAYCAGYMKSRWVLQGIKMPPLL